MSGTIEGPDDPATNMRLTLELLETCPDLRGIYNVGGSSEGIGLALQRAGRAGQVRLIGHGLSSGTRRMLQDGTIMAVFTQRTQKLLEVMLDQLHTPTLPSLLPMQIVFPTNLPAE
ncbi:LacI family DNA-binding transcriptional regulator [Frigidibacter albus]|uniref:LacI family transcriptional regulator n=1 Tax=Frigidibacter mobilis TaxID=1335048 RepID=A0A159Z6M5_9RHOB|nr:substrate-binding domain-containing protein [Frigidibacter mobilis]AMY70996.1 LacI family transcriptional regulator [Frigidibacter mobilis]